MMQTLVSAKNSDWLWYFVVPWLNYLG